MFGNTYTDPGTYGTLAHAHPMGLLVLFLLFAALMLAIIGCLYLIAWLLERRQKRQASSQLVLAKTDNQSGNGN